MCIFLLIIYTVTVTIKINFCSVICSIFHFFFYFQDDRYFLSGSLDGKLRLWNIPEKKVTMWNEVSSLITTANFCHNGKFAVAGTYDGKCIFYTTEVNLLWTINHDILYKNQVNVLQILVNDQGKNSVTSRQLIYLEDLQYIFTSR